ncbi:LysR family transcriptional regulator [Sinirhodobacter populi]|uniref:LysR family transcriptional regulator n=1 Tax=Paenirhodobacter populi TaxID=2306993 RepID=A0A443JZI0_9RHOB|nr:LysR family transcriptional regulator [Sinirhodobacter populi]RWR25927.1 LysR family transcriptional regulator [Sinirhodobacter populi]
MDLLDGLRAFVATAQTGSFTAAAERLGLSNRLTSKYVAELESRLGVRLLQRTTRRVGITPAGEEMLLRAPALLDEIEDLLASTSAGSRGYTGVLRISAPVSFGESHVKDLLSRFAAHHPGLSIDLRLDDGFVDLATAGIDLAFRIGEPGQQSLKARRLGTLTSALVASPGYLARCGAVLVPADLEKHDCIVDTNRRNPFLWPLLRDGEETVVAVRSRFMVNSAQIARDLAVSGIGVAFCPRFVLRDDLASGRLVELLPDYRSRTAPLNAVYLEGRVLPRKIRALIDFAAAELRRDGLD